MPGSGDVTYSHYFLPSLDICNVYYISSKPLALMQHINNGGCIYKSTFGGKTHLKPVMRILYIIYKTKNIGLNAQRNWL